MLFKQNDVSASNNTICGSLLLVLLCLIWKSLHSDLSYFVLSLNGSERRTRCRLFWTRPLRSENSFELQIVLKINIHICAQSCTWKKLTYYKKCKRLFLLLWSQEIRHNDPVTLVLYVLSCSASVSV